MLPANTANAQDAGWSAFIVMEDENAFTDERSVSLAAFDPGPMSSKSVMFSCLPNAKAILLSDGRTRFGQTVVVRYRIDDHEAQEFSGVLSGDGGGVILLNVSNQRFDRMASEIAEGEVLRFQIDRGSVQEVPARLSADDLARFYNICGEINQAG